MTFLQRALAYAPDMCPRTLDLLCRPVAVSLDQRMTAQHSALLAAAIRKVARALSG